MANGTELRGIALEILLEITQEKEYSHLAIRNALNKVQYLPKQDRAFINRLVEGTLEYMLRIDYVLNQFSSVRVNKMKPVTVTFFEAVFISLCLWTACRTLQPAMKR